MIGKFCMIFSELFTDMSVIPKESHLREHEAARSRILEGFREPILRLFSIIHGPMESSSINHNLNMASDIVKQKMGTNFHRLI